MNKNEFARRRKRLMQAMGKESIAILPNAPVRQRNRDVEHAYRPDSDFYYLTGFAEPESVAVIVPGRVHGEYILFCRERDPLMETWHGRRAGLEGAMPSPLVTSTRSCPACWRIVSGSSTPWAVIVILIPR